MEANRPPLDSSPPGTVPGAALIEQPPVRFKPHPVHAHWVNIEEHPQYRTVCKLYKEVRDRTQWSTYQIKNHIAILMRLPQPTVKAIILDNYGID